MKEKKKIKKIILYIILILIVVFIVRKVYSIHIMLKVSDAIDEFNIRNDFSYTEIEQANSIDDYKTTIIKKDNIFVVKKGRSEDMDITWYDSSSTNKYYDCCRYDLDTDNETWIQYLKKDIEDSDFFSSELPYRISDFANFRKLLTRSDLDKKEKIELIISSTLVSSEKYDEIDCYTYKMWGAKFYIDKKTMLPIAETFSDDGMEIPMIRMEYNTEYDENILKEPDSKEFKSIRFLDNINRNSNYDEFSNKSISGTNQDPTENLIENVALTENEKLDVLPITGNSFGVKSIQIDNLKTYNTFREDYSNLRELTEEDFVYYSVFIVYKNGYELNFLEYQETNQSYNIGYIFTEKETENDNLVLIIKPRAQKNNPDIIISNEKIKIGADKIFEIYYSATKEIEKELGFTENSLFCSSDDIVKLDYETYKDLDYIKTPVKEGIELLCWQIKTSVYVEKNNYQSVATYINAITGEVIGAKCWK